MPISVHLQEADLKAQPKSVPAHLITRRLSLNILKAGLARQVGRDEIQLTTAASWAEIKRMARAHVDPFLIRITPQLPINRYREYPGQLTCMEAAFQRCMRYPVQIAKDQSSWQYSWERDWQMEPATA